MFHYNKLKRNHVGFSLVELLVVIAILAVLAAIAIPLFLNQRTKAAQAVVQSDARNVATDLTSLFSNLPPTSNAAVSLNSNANPNIAVSGNVTLSVTGESTTISLSPNITLTKTGNADPAIGSGLKFSNTSNPTYICTISLPTTTPYSWLMNLQPQCGTVVSEMGNLFTYNQATFSNKTTSGWFVTRLTPTYPNTNPSNGVLLTINTATDPYLHANFSLSTAGISAGETLTATVEIKTDTTPIDYAAASIYFANASGWMWGANRSIGTVTSGKDWTVITGTAVVPEGAQQAYVIAGVRPWVVGKTFELNKVGIWQGDGGTWSPPGVPIVKP